MHNSFQVARKAGLATFLFIKFLRLHIAFPLKEKTKKSRRKVGEVLARG